jgi:hypothetical protein
MSFCSILSFVADIGVHTPTKEEVHQLFTDTCILEPSRARSKIPAQTECLQEARREPGELLEPWPWKTENDMRPEGMPESHAPAAISPTFRLARQSAQR